MLDAFGQKIQLSKKYAFTQANGGVRTTYLGTINPLSDTHVTMNVSETLCFSMDGFLFENRTWDVRPPREVNTVLLFPLDSLQRQQGM